MPDNENHVMRDVSWGPSSLKWEAWTNFCPTGFRERKPSEKKKKKKGRVMRYMLSVNRIGVDHLDCSEFRLSGPPWNKLKARTRSPEVSSKAAKQTFRNLPAAFDQLF